jgi:hypothetical protein
VTLSENESLFESLAPWHELRRPNAAFQEFRAHGATTTERQLGNRRGTDFSMKILQEKNEPLADVDL